MFTNVKNAIELMVLIPVGKSKRCPHCNGKLVALQKRGVFKVGRNSLLHMETYQPFRCKRCKKEVKMNG